MESLFEYYIESDNLHLKYAKGEPAVRKQEFHNYNEFVLFINGNASLISKNIQQKLTHGSLILIPKEHFHAKTDTVKNKWQGPNRSRRD